MLIKILVLAWLLIKCIDTNYFLVNIAFFSISILVAQIVTNY